jgi:hypothetical protein
MSLKSLKKTMTEYLTQKNYRKLGKKNSEKLSLQIFIIPNLKTVNV